MNKNIISAALFVTLLGLCVHQGSAIMCWDCNSALDPRCGESRFDPHTLDVVDCSQLYRDNLNGINAKYCRKIIQTVNGITRTVRGCGWLEETKAPVGKCYTRTGTKDVMVTFCHCEGDRCNSATSFAASLAFVVSLGLLVKVF